MVAVKPTYTHIGTVMDALVRCNQYTYAVTTVKLAKKNNWTASPARTMLVPAVDASPSSCNVEEMIAEPAPWMPMQMRSMTKKTVAMVLVFKKRLHVQLRLSLDGHGIDCDRFHTCTQVHSMLMQNGLKEVRNCKDCSKMPFQTQ